MAIKKKATIKEKISESFIKDKDFNDNKSFTWIDSIVGNRQYGGYESSSYSIDLIRCHNTLKGDSIKILIKNDINNHQQGGSFHLSDIAARWLAKSINESIDSK